MVKRLSSRVTPGSEAAEQSSPKERLLRRATEHVARNGLEGLDIRSLAVGAGTSTSQFSKFFESRAQLLAAVFDQGWQALEHHVFPRLVRATGSIEEKLVAILEGVLDALEKDEDAVSATLIIVMSTTGHSVRAQLKEKPAHGRFHDLVNALRAEFTASMTQDEADELLELLYGAVLRRLVLLSPLCRNTVARPFDRALFLRTMRRLVHGALQSGATDLRT